MSFGLLLTQIEFELECGKSVNPQLCYEGTAITFNPSGHRPSTTGPFRSPSPNCSECTFCTCTICHKKELLATKGNFKLLMVVISVKSNVYLAIQYQMCSIRLKQTSGLKSAIKKVIYRVKCSKKTKCDIEQRNHFFAILH